MAARGVRFYIPNEFTTQIWIELDTLSYICISPRLFIIQ